MAWQDSTDVRNAMLDAREATVGASPKLRAYSGTVPANPAASIGSATLLAEATLPSDWQAAASGGSKSKAGTWTFDAAAASGTPTFVRLYASDGTSCKGQGTAGVGSGDVNFAGSITAGQTGIQVTAFTFNDGNP